MSKNNELNEEIVAALDIEAEYRSILGDKATGTPNENGWCACFAMDRPQGDSPSAGFNVVTGVYKDFGGSGEVLSFFSFMGKYGKHADWRDARKHFAKQVGLSRRLPRKDEEKRTFREKVQVIGPVKEVHILGLKGRYPLINWRGMRLCGAQFGRYASGMHVNTVIVLDAYGPGLANEPARGCCLMSSGKQDLWISKGEGNPPDRKKSINLDTSGLVGRKGVDILKKAELVIKVEGLSELITLQSIIPDGLIDKIAVITNAAGAHETTLPAEVAHLFSGKDVVLIGDHDEPGQDGVKIWTGVLNGIAGSVRAPRLYDEPVAETKGKDLRDWLEAGNGWVELKALIDATKPVSVGPDASAESTMTVHQAILKRFGIVIRGHIQDTDTILGMSEGGRPFKIKNIEKYKLEQLVFHVGEHVLEHIAGEGRDDPTRVSMSQLRLAIAIEGGKHAITDENQLGLGIWEMSGRLVLVNSGSSSLCNGTLTRLKSSIMEDKVIDSSAGPDQKWFDHDELNVLWEASESAEWRENAFSDAADIFGRWDNLKHPDDPNLLAALVACTWLQTVWDFRPGVCISGGSNSGKTFLIQKCVAEMFGNMAILTGASMTEAGVRQALGHTAKAVLLDEFEKSEARERILDMFKVGTRGGEIYRGTAGSQKAMKFKVQSMLWISAIETGLVTQADRNRFIHIELGSVDASRGSRLNLEDVDMRDIGQRLMVVAMRLWSPVRALSLSLRQMTFGGTDRRVVEAYSVPVAMMAAVAGLDQDESVRLMDRTLSNRDTSDASQSDEEDLLDDILVSSVIVPGHGQISVSSLLSMPENGLGDRCEQTPSEVLATYGIRKTREDGLFVAYGRSKKTGLLRGSRFDGGRWETILKRIDGAKEKTLAVAGRHSRGVEIPSGRININGWNGHQDQAAMFEEGQGF